MSRSLHYVAAFLALVVGLINCVSSKKGQSTQQGTSATTNALAEGKELFTTNCISCHALEEDGMGPRLGGVSGGLSEKQFVAFVNNPARFIDAGDERAVALHARYKLLMPPFEFLGDDKIKAIFAYLDQETKQRSIAPLPLEQINSSSSKALTGKLTPVIRKSGLKLELEEFAQIPFSSETPPRTRLATMRPHPSADGTLYVSDQRGIIYRIENGQVGTFLDVRDKIQDFINTPGLATGLGSFIFHPEYLQNGLIYITHTEAYKRKPADFEYADSVKVAMQWVLSEWKIKDVKSKVFEGDRRELLRINVPSQVHGVQDINFIPGLSKRDSDYGLLYMGIGDGGTTIGRHPELCHTITSLLGTIIRIDPRGSNSPNGKYGIPADNPFVKETNPAVRKEIWAYGFRNPHRQTWDLAHGKRMFSTEVGEVHIEEVNVIEKGGDYGWNVREGTLGISAKELKSVFLVNDGPNSPYRVPFVQYDHLDGNAISGGPVYRGPLAALDGKYLFGDIVSGRIFHVNIDKQLTDSTAYEIGLVQGTRETTMQELTATKRVDLRIDYNPYTKELYLMSKNDGKIRRVTKAYFEKNP
ncbi:hypothetical protein GCM10027275_35470 [Rhabdobacter roseus]|uniref:Mono/diheme cytochrome c family protein n=1 Tax=Rhabdobacter roseus TaxID=1655419 RepID=A0A840TZ99_9BACT|nr:PQQ-dependent sugar dehydrogenase [Rhabdobacter roseus]MBB5285230.1 mono/diheme cytochrome c family protein [Rhabdobacter roseus]